MVPLYMQSEVIFDQQKVEKLSGSQIWLNMLGTFLFYYIENMAL